MPMMRQMLTVRHTCLLQWLETKGAMRTKRIHIIKLTARPCFTNCRTSNQLQPVLQQHLSRRQSVTLRQLWPVRLTAQETKLEDGLEELELAGLDTALFSRIWMSPPTTNPHPQIIS